MKIAYYEESGKMSVVDLDKPKIQKADDAIIRVIRSCVCGSDLWAYSAGDSKQKHSINDGHEAIGIVEEVGESVTTVKPGDFVIVPFTHGSTNQAFGVVRPGGFIGRVGLPHGSKMDPAETFYRNVTLAGGPASVTTYDKEVLLKAVLDGDINPGKVFTNSYKLDEIDQAYKDMADRRTIKSYLIMD